jgi:hypothetical protein
MVIHFRYYVLTTRAHTAISGWCIALQQGKCFILGRGTRDVEFIVMHTRFGHTVCSLVSAIRSRHTDKLLSALPVTGSAPVQVEPAGETSRRWIEVDSQRYRPLPVVTLVVVVSVILFF